MSFANELLTLCLIPLAVSVALALLVRWLGGKPQVAWAAAVGVAFIAGNFALASRTSFARGIRALLAPSEAPDWLPHAVLLALGVTIFAAYAPRRWRLAAAALAGLLSIGVPARLLAGNLAQQWSGLEKLLHLALLGATLALAWLLLSAARDYELPRLRQILIVLVSLGAAVVTTLSGSFTFGRLCGVVAAALSGAALVSPRGLSGAAGVVIFSLGGIIILCVFYAGLHPAGAALLFASLAASAGRLPDLASNWPTWQQAALRTALCLLPLTIVLAASL